MQRSFAMHKLLKAVDSYKLNHFKFYPEGTTHMESYIESRGFTSPFDVEPEVLFFGIRSFIKEYLSVPITHADIDAFETMVIAHGLPFNRAGWERIVDFHKGYVPVEIEAFPEGSIVPIKVPLVQIINNDPELPWLTSYIETALLRAIWYPTTVATLSREAKKIIKKYLEKTADNLDGLPFKLHDFGARGVSSGESAALGGAAHLINFMGTDTVEALFYVHEYYKFNGPAGFSIPATEHSISTLYDLLYEYEYADSVISLIENGAPLAAIVADTYDLENFVSNVLGSEHRERISKLKGTLVVRPDSGDPVDITLNVVKRLGNAFGFTRNSKGYKVLPPFIRMIQGDGINLPMIEEILANFEIDGWSADNIAFGIGGGLLQSVNRDTLKFAMKANQAIVKINQDISETRLLQKNPKTDPGKASKAGDQIVYRNEEGQIVSVSSVFCTNEQADGHLLEVAYSMFGGEGVLDRTEADFASIRERAKI
jgi:nicotinamide phosphoribosyltransferase